MNETPKALIIEDYVDQAIVFDTAVKMAGFETEMIVDGALAQERLKEVVPDLIILDLHMPGVTGEQLLKQIRADARMEKTRVIIASADALRAQQLSSQVDMVLLKPISFTQLNQLAGRLFAHPKK